MSIEISCSNKLIFMKRVQHFYIVSEDNEFLTISFLNVFWDSRQLTQHFFTLNIWEHDYDRSNTWTLKWEQNNACSVWTRAKAFNVDYINRSLLPDECDACQIQKFRFINLEMDFIVEMEFDSLTLKPIQCNKSSLNFCLELGHKLPKIKMYIEERGKTDRQTDGQIGSVKSYPHSQQKWSLRDFRCLMICHWLYWLNGKRLGIVSCDFSTWSLLSIDWNS